MKLTIAVLVFLLFCSLSVLAQSPYGIKGSVIDTASNSRLANTTISILNVKDSTLVKFTRASATGAFAIDGLHKGKFIMMVTYPDYADYVEFFELDSIKREKNFGRLNMKLKSRLLHEIMVQGTKAAIKIKGDTTEFNASSFVVQPNAKVEDLLKQLPGIEVDKDGKITAQGQAVNKVLVDGEEFFGDDPTLVTKNIRADMVDKVQLYDKKSDQATFTGIDDGVKNKTINIKLKEDAKNGYFGKVDAGIGTDKYYQGQGAFNIFKGRQKFSVYGTLANTGKTGLGWDDNAKYGAGDNMTMTDDGGIYFSSSRDELEAYGGNYDGHGIPLARTAGSHYDGKFDGDKQSLNGNYKIGYLEVNGINSSINQNNLPNAILNSNSDQTFTNSIFRQKFDLTYQLKIDSLSNLKLSVDGTQKHSETNNNYLQTNYRNFDTLLNRSIRNINNKVDGQVFDASAFYNKKFKKAGRSFSWSVSEAYTGNKTNGYLNQFINYYNTNTADSTNQYKTSNTTSSNLTSNITYSEPFTKTFALVANYGTGYNKSSSDKKSFNKSPGGQYNLLDTTYSNDYSFAQFSNQLGANFSYRTNKTVFNFGTKATNVQFDQINETNGMDFKRTFLNWNPQANYQYKFTQYKSFSINYNGSTSQPTIDQIQPVVNNNDKLYITLGNPDLKPSFRNNFNMYYNTYKVLSGESFYVSGNYSFTVNPIVGNTITDPNTGGMTVQSFNLTTKNPYNFSFYSGFSEKLKKSGISLGTGLSGSGSVSYNYVNTVLNTTSTYNYTLRLNVQKFAEKKYDFYFNVNPGYTLSGSSLQPDANNNAFTINGYSFVNVYLPGKLQIGYEANYDYRGKSAAFNDDFSKLILNANLAKKFLKDESLKLTLSVNDLFNQNVGFNRSTYGSTISQSSYTTIKRYFLFSITYDFSQMGGAKSK